MQKSFFKTNHQVSHGGDLRKSRKGRGSRPLATKVPIHLVFKVNKKYVKGGLRLSKRFQLIHQLLQIYQAKFFIKVEQISIQNDHIHLLVRTSKRSNYQNFFRVFAGQIAQRMKNRGLLTIDDSKQAVQLWKHRPFTRVVRGGWRAIQVVRNYIQLNEKEALGIIPYKKERLRGLSLLEWEFLWT